MKLIQESDIYGFIQGGHADTMNKQIADLISKGMKICTKEIDYNIRTVEKAFKDPLTVEAINAVMAGTIVPFVALNPTNAMPMYMPFIKYTTSNGDTKVAIDLTQMAHIKHDLVNDTWDIDINNSKLYVMLVSAYVYLNFSNKTSVLTPTLMNLTGDIWAKLVLRIFDNKFGLSTNRERKEAFTYFAKKFYLKNILEAVDGVIENNVLNIFPNKKKSPMVNEIEATIADRGINLYESFQTFITTMLNYEITGLNVNRLNLPKEKMGLSFFMKEFVTLYGAPAGFSLAAFPYFMWMLISANNRGWIFNGEKNIEAMSKNEFPKIMTEFYRMIRL